MVVVVGAGFEPADDDGHLLHPHGACETYEDVRVQTASVAWVSVVSVSVVLGIMLCRKDQINRRRYPGRLVPCFGCSILLFNLMVASGLVIDFEQLNWVSEQSD